MQDITNAFLLITAIAASLAFGVFAALTLCRTAFAVFRVHSVSVANSKLKLEKAEAAS